MIIYKNIKEIAKRKNIQQKDIAEAFGVTENTMTNYLTGRTKITADQIPMFAKALRVSIDQLFQEVGTPLKSNYEAPEIKLDTVDDGCPKCREKDAEINKWKDKYIYLLETGHVKKENSTAGSQKAG